MYDITEHHCIEISMDTYCQLAPVLVYTYTVKCPKLARRPKFATFGLFVTMFKEYAMGTSYQF